MFRSLVKASLLVWQLQNSISAIFSFLLRPTIVAIFCHQLCGMHSIAVFAASHNQDHLPHQRRQSHSNILEYPLLHSGRYHPRTMRNCGIDDSLGVHLRAPFDTFGCGMRLGDSSRPLFRDGLSSVLTRKSAKSRSCRSVDGRACPSRKEQKNPSTVDQLHIPRPVLPSHLSQSPLLSLARLSSSVVTREIPSPPLRQVSFPTVETSVLSSLDPLEGMSSSPVALFLAGPMPNHTRRRLDPYKASSLGKSSSPSLTLSFDHSVPLFFSSTASSLTPSFHIPPLNASREACESQTEGCEIAEAASHERKVHHARKKMKSKGVGGKRSRNSLSNNGQTNVLELLVSSTSSPSINQSQGLWDKNTGEACDKRPCDESILHSSRSPVENSPPQSLERSQSPSPTAPYPVVEDVIQHSPLSSSSASSVLHSNTSTFSSSFGTACSSAVSSIQANPTTQNHSPLGSFSNSRPHSSISLTSKASLSSNEVDCYGESSECNKENQTPTDSLEIIDGRIGQGEKEERRIQTTNPGWMTKNNRSIALSIAKKLIAICLWYGTNCHFNIENKKALNYLPLPFTVAALQSLVGVPLAVLPWILGLRAPPSIRDMNGWLAFTVQAIWHTVLHLAAMTALAAGAVSFVSIVKAGEPVVTALLAHVLYQRRLSALRYMFLIPIIFGVALASLKELSFSWTAFTGAMLSNMGSSLRGLSAKETLSSPERIGMNLTAPNVFALTHLISTLLEIPMVLVERNIWSQKIEKYLQDEAVKDFQSSGLKELGQLNRLSGSSGPKGLSGLNRTIRLGSSRYPKHLNAVISLVKQALSFSSPRSQTTPPVTSAPDWFNRLMPLLPSARLTSFTPFSKPVRSPFWKFPFSRAAELLIRWLPHSLLGLRSSSSLKNDTSSFGLSAIFSSSIRPSSISPSSIKEMLTLLKKHPSVIRHIVLSGITYYLYNDIAMAALSGVSPVSHAVVNTLKRVTVIIASAIVFRTKFTPLGILGSAIAVGGTFGYSLSKKLEQKNPKKDDRNQKSDQDPTDTAKEVNQGVQENRGKTILT